MFEWRAFCANGAGAELEREVQAAIQGDGDRLWDYLAQSYAGWGERHIFGNLKAFEESDAVGFMALKDVYVEPDAHRSGMPNTSCPALKAVLQTTKLNRLTVLSGAMGYGKTLTARTLVVELAKHVREAQAPLRQRWHPVYVLCREHLKPNSTLASLVSEAVRAEWAEMSGDWLDEQDDRIKRPLDRKILVVLDGFDEVVMDEKSRQTLVEGLFQSTSGDQHLLIISPGQECFRRRCLRCPNIMSLVRSVRLSRTSGCGTGETSIGVDLRITKRYQKNIVT
ncbi:MAG: NACHT domain-containing protein [Deltaproteobacteria bacterium]|nr:NACHT domain-containing protein [Deltaproteobacteria bacterium]